MKKTIYRIENEKAEGAYSDGAAFIACKLATSSWKHNPPDVDFHEHFSMNRSQCDKKWFFGFKNLHQLYRWFDTVESIAYLEMKGLKIVKYEVDYRNYHSSDVQCIFLMKKAKPVGSIAFCYDKLERKYILGFKQ